jgi:hypothetical protein
VSGKSLDGAVEITTGDSVVVEKIKYMQIPQKKMHRLPHKLMFQSYLSGRGEKALYEFWYKQENLDLVHTGG